MNNLSHESQSFLRNLRNVPANEGEDPTWKIQYATLFSEFFNVIGTATDSLSELSLGKWSLCYESDDAQNLAFTFRLNHSKQEALPQMVIRMEPFGESFIAVSGCSKDRVAEDSNDPRLTSFFDSSAYKRYFSPYESGKYHLKTVLPQRQIMSRHLGDYMNHLFRMMQPYLLVICKGQNAVKRAA